MKSKFILLVLSSAITFLSEAQRPAPDFVPAKQTDINIQPILHGTVVFTWNNKVIYADPYGGGKAFEGIAAPDLILITDIHGDHLNVETLKTLDLTKAVLIVPQAVADQLPEDMKAKTVILSNGASTTQIGISISAIPMYNLPEADDSRHTKGRGNGYLVKLGGKNIYLSGDTSDIPEMRSLKDIDIAFVCMNLPFTMDINQAASAVLDFKPTIVYPYHYRGQGGLSDVEGFKKLVNDGNKKIEVRLRNWYPTY
jgi:L-ascorbate metabolism protein UlaG (beta-lactamase superfamily)